MVTCITQVEKMHELLPTPFLSAVIDDCLTRGMDVTQGGARYNFAGVQAIQIANVADSLAAIKLLVYDEKSSPRRSCFTHCKPTLRTRRLCARCC